MFRIPLLFVIISVALMIVLGIDSDVAEAAVPTWVVGFDQCTEYQTTLEQFMTELEVTLARQQYASQRRDQRSDIIKAREDVNKLVATVYNELRTQQIIDFSAVRNVLHSVGIAAVARREDGTYDDTDEMCPASHHVRADIGQEGSQCVAVLQEARLITDSDDYIYEEGRRKAMDALFCYLGDWRHFPIARINDPANCRQLGISDDQVCSVSDIWTRLGMLLFDNPDFFNDVGGAQSPDNIIDDQHVFNLCEGMRTLGLKCAQDMLRDYIKYSTIDTITRKDRTIILAPPQTWYTPDRCQILNSFFPSQNEALRQPDFNTPFTKYIKSLNVADPGNFLPPSSFSYIDWLYGRSSKFGNPTLTKPPSNMDDAEFTVEKELQAISIPENSFAGLAAKAETIANQIIRETTELRKLQYTAGEGLREATVRIGWQDYEWDAETDPPKKRINSFLGKYEALDLVQAATEEGPFVDPGRPNKVFRPLPCYWGAANPSISLGGRIDSTRFCEIFDRNIPSSPSGGDGAQPNGQFFYFDTGIVIAPLAITKAKIDSAIQAQFDLAQKAFGESTHSFGEESYGSCQAGFRRAVTIEGLPAPWEDIDVNLSSAINPLTGEPYTYGAPGPNNPPFRIPGINNNYFNFLYNDVFQLYHTPFPDVLAGWFRLNDPAYDSIYGPLASPIAFDPSGAPGSGPPGGGGIGGGAGLGGSGTRTCLPVQNGPCSIQSLQTSCFAQEPFIDGNNNGIHDNVEKASAICNAESGGNAALASGVDICQPSGPPASWGLFQINISVHDMPSVPGGANDALNCAPGGPDNRPSAAFDRGYTGKKGNVMCSIDNQSLYNQCVAAATDANLNIQKACQLSNNGENWSDWGANSRCGFGPGPLPPSPPSGGGSGGGPGGGASCQSTGAAICGGRFVESCRPSACSNINSQVGRGTAPTDSSGNFIDCRVPNADALCGEYGTTCDGCFSL